MRKLLKLVEEMQHQKQHGNFHSAEKITEHTSKDTTGNDSSNVDGIIIISGC